MEGAGGLGGVGIGRLASWVAEPFLRDGTLVRVCSDYRIVSSSGQDPVMHAVYGSRGLPKRAALFLESIRKRAKIGLPT
jgi:DNA-binding transcriptional LysR family regulator